MTDNVLLYKHIVLLPPANEVWGKIIFSQASVILSTERGGGFPACITGHMTSGVCIQRGGLHPGADPPPPALQDTVSKRAVRTLLESFLVTDLFAKTVEFLPM